MKWMSRPLEVNFRCLEPSLILLIKHFNIIVSLNWNNDRILACILNPFAQIWIGLKCKLPITCLFRDHSWGETGKRLEYEWGMGLSSGGLARKAKNRPEDWSERSFVSSRKEVLKIPGPVTYPRGGRRNGKPEVSWLDVLSWCLCSCLSHFFC